MRVDIEMCNRFKCDEWVIHPHADSQYTCGLNCHNQMVYRDLINGTDTQCPDGKSCQECERFHEIPAACPWRMEIILLKRKKSR